jgi:hypothetical protein
MMAEDTEVVSGSKERPRWAKLWIEVRLQFPGAWRDVRSVVLELGVAVVAVGAGAWLYAASPANVVPLASIEFAPSPSAAARLAAGQARGIALYTAGWILGALALVLIYHVGSRILASEVRRRLVRGALVGAGAAAVMAGLAALLLIGYPENWWPGREWVVRTAQALAFARNCLLAVVLPVAFGVLVVTLDRVGRRFRHSQQDPWVLGDHVIPRRRDGFRPSGPAAGAPPVEPAAHDGTVDVAARASESQLTPADTRVARRVHEDIWLPADRELRGTGICVSGGGIRSACVALGALQALQRRGVLEEAAYLVSVSGGGYTAGAYQLALTSEPDQPATRHGRSPVRTEATPHDVLNPGSPEEDHLRRHSSYVADSAMDWAAAMGTLLRGVLANLALLSGTVIALGGLIYLFYRYTPVISITDLAPIYAAHRGPDPAPPHVPAIQPGVAMALVVALTLSVLTYSVGLAGFATAARPAQRTIKAAKAFTTLTVLLAVFGVLVPLLLWATGRLTWNLGLHNRRGLTPAGIGTVLLTYVGAIIGILWRRRDQISKQVGGGSGRENGRRYYLHSHLGGLGVFGHGDRLSYEGGDRVGNG